MTLPVWSKKILWALLALLLAAGTTAVYYRVLEIQLAGYRGIKQYQLEQSKQRELRRRLIAGVPAARERLLREEFGDLPEAPDIRKDLELVNIWQRMVMLFFGFTAWGTFAYALRWRHRIWWQRLAVGALVLVVVAEALPLMVLPEEALRLFRRVGLPIVMAGGALLAVQALWERWRRSRAAQ